MQCRRPRFNSWVGKIPWRRDRLPTPIFLGFPGGSDGKETISNAGDLGSFPELGRFLVERKGYPLQYSYLEKSMDRRAWWATVHGVTKSQTQLSDLFSHKKEEILSFLRAWMKLEGIMSSEIRQTKKDKYCMV